jgi:hypothetical protein
MAATSQTASAGDADCWYGAHVSANGCPPAMYAPPRYVPAWSSMTWLASVSAPVSATPDDADGMNVLMVRSGGDGGGLGGGGSGDGGGGGDGGDGGGLGDGGSGGSGGGGGGEGSWPSTLTSQMER